MELLAPMLYTLCVFLKCTASCYAFRAWAKMSCEFAQGSPTNVRKNATERLFHSTLFGIVANVMFVPAITLYVLNYGGWTLGPVEILFLTGHLFDSLYSLSTHHHTYVEACRKNEKEK